MQRGGFPFHNLYKMTIMLRGRQLMTDIEDSERVGEPSWPVQIANVDLQPRLEGESRPLALRLAAHRSGDAPGLIRIAAAPRECHRPT